MRGPDGTVVRRADPKHTLINPLPIPAEIDPDALLDPQADYVIEVTAALRDLSGNPAVPFTSTFDSGPAAAS